MAALKWNRWQHSSGIGGSFEPEYAILNMNKIIQHIWMEIRAENTEKLAAVFDKEHPIRSTANVRTWYTSKPCEWLKKSHISHSVYDSTWEASEAYFLEKSESVQSFVKNDHLVSYQPSLYIF